MSRWGKPRKNVKRIDPRYFMDEKMDEKMEEIDEQPKQKISPPEESRLKQILKEEFKEAGLLKEQEEAIGFSTEGLEVLLSKLLAQLKKLDLSIDYLSSAFMNEAK